MSNCLENPVMPCAMAGACAILSGFSGLSIIIHGSSGCYYYPRSILKKPMFSTLLLESEVIFGTVNRLHDTIIELERGGKPVAVINTCIPAITGEDLSKAFNDTNAIFVDAPGFIGNAEKGVEAAYQALNIKTTEREGVNIDGICGLDLFARGNLLETKRILQEANIPIALSLASDTYENLQRGAARVTVTANPSWSSGIGENLGSFLFSDLKETISKLESKFAKSNFDTIYEEIETVDSQLFYYADKFLRKYQPPTTVIVSQKSYCNFASWMLTRYFGADIAAVIPRENDCDSTKINEIIRDSEPDLLLASSFEASQFDVAFYGITHPDRSRVTIASRPITGIEGALNFMENIQNVLIDFWKRKE
ncbi:MAG TPA: oxidoreductase [Methanocorpusculum sp.]|nr:oxidoreductase [Methanocorpusculum sp.]